MLVVQILDAAKLLEGESEVEIILDAEGLELLTHQLEHLKKGSTHAHLMTPAWGGNELSEIATENGATVVNHLRIAMLKKENSE